MNAPKANAVLVEALGSSLRYGGSALTDVPELLKRILEEGAWREFVTTRGETVQHERFFDFVTTPPTRGLGATVELIDRMAGTGDPDLLRMLQEAKKGSPGRPKNGSESEPFKAGQTESATYTADRLARDAPEEFAAVQRGEKSLNAAARAAGIRRPRTSIRLDSAESAAHTLRKHMAPETLTQLVKLLEEDHDDT